jgi:hypothetical protein
MRIIIHNFHHSFTTEDAEDTEDIVEVTSSLILLIQTV